MSTLTKIFIVLLVLLVVAATPLFIQQAITPPNYLAAYRAEQQKARLAQANAVLAENQRLALDAESAATIASLRQTIKRANQENQALKQTNEQLRTSLTAEKNRLNKQDATLAGMKDSLAEAVAMQKETASQLAAQIEAGQQLKTQLIRMELDFNEVTRKLERAGAEVQRLRESVAVRDAKILELEAQLAKGGTVGGTAPETTAAAQPTAIKGRVTAVQVAQNVAQLNVGSADGVAEGMRFILYRGDELVGHLVVAVVEPNLCAGTLANLQSTPQQGDWATTSLGPK